MAFVSMNLCENIEKKKHGHLPSNALSQRRHPTQRSRSIKIPRDVRNKVTVDDDTLQLQEHYNHATLRMYYRITDYRNRNALRASNTGSHNNSATTNQPLPASSNLSNTGMMDEEESAATSLEESDAIFEMDL
jgi:hypothetical protein